MASSSSIANDSQYCSRWKYDVFLCFRGEDTRRTFTSHLYEGMKNRGIFTFQDDIKLEHGASISDELLKAIEESQVALVIQYGQTVIPIFYDVDPSEVRNRKESFAEAFAKHESKYRDDFEGIHKVKRWRTALSAATDLKGYDIRQG
ncbi:hypothetical protein KY290_025192 [Solanum tuberosum]|uniref:TIR domain-containing protein n=1 Tax=Solanum tuberosum TaxID=4113 RepID=A0ABQ7USU3_SOLTU|nr:hypothetical protein KY284_023997 [Solanum tuberosum]KAH0754922.1 hypothetical protein KY290_025192 [Solanum tuberosum]